MPEPADDRPMTEAEWERFMQESDARSARFGELFETLIDHPERDAIIAREMGWDRRESDPEFVDAMNEAAEAALAEKSAGPLDNRGDPFDDEDGYQSLPAYQKAFEWGLRVHDVLEPRCEALRASHDLDLEDAIGGSMTVGAKLASGYAMHDSEDMPGGCIVKCRLGLEEAQKALAGLAAIAKSGLVPADQIESLIADGREVQQLVEAYLAELRSRVWWE